jgi:isochorismate hydrolase
VALPIFLIVSGVSSLILVVMVVGLVRHVRVLAGSLQAFQREIQPVMTEIRTEAERARVHLEEASASAEGLRPGAEPGRRR